MPAPSSFRATPVEHGWFHPRESCPTVPNVIGRRFRNYALEGLAETVQYEHVSVRAADSTQLGVHIVISAHYPRIEEPRLSRIEIALRRQFSHAELSFTLEDKYGFARVKTLNPSADVAVAVALTKAIGAWDESAPIEVAFDDVRFAVSLEFSNFAWDAQVTQIVTSP